MDSQQLAMEMLPFLTLLRIKGSTGHGFYNTGVPKSIKMQYNIKSYPSTQQLMLRKLYPNIGGGYSNKKVKGKLIDLLDGVHLYGQKPGHIKPNRQDARLDIHTELVSPFPEEAARGFFAKLTGEKPPINVNEQKLLSHNGELVYYRRFGENGHPKVEVTQSYIGRISNIEYTREKITFKQDLLKIAFKKE